MLAAPTTTTTTNLPKPVVSLSTDSTNSTTTSTTNSLSNKYQRTSFDSFEPFYTPPSVFGITSNNTKSHLTYDHHSILFNTHQQQKDDYRLLYQQQSSPESFFSLMADLESPSTRTPSPKNDASSYYYCDTSSSMNRRLVEDASHNFSTSGGGAFNFNNNSTAQSQSQTPSSSLYNHQQHSTTYQLKVDNHATLAAATSVNNHTNHDQIMMMTTTTESNNSSSFGGGFYPPSSNNNSLMASTTAIDNNNEIHHYIDKLSIDSLRQYCKESIDTIQSYKRQIKIISMESEKRNINLQARIQDMEQQLRLTNQNYSHCQTELTQLKAQIQSKGGLNLSSIYNISGEILPAVTSNISTGVETSEIITSGGGFNNSRLVEYGTSTLSSDSDITPTSSCFNMNRRWSEERLPYASAMSNSSTTNTSTTTTANCYATEERKFTQQQVDYRMLVDKNVNVNWDSLVDRIIKETDQKASLLLQNRLKCASMEQREAIFQSIYKQAYELMKNRFGNFLVQKLFELGSRDQINLLAHCMKGKVLELTCDTFGCHVVQKVLDYVHEDIKSSIVSELFQEIPNTITHRHACHVWQKVFGIRWSRGFTPPPIIHHVHQSLQGQWAQVALDETGSLLIQNIFENLTEEDKRPVIKEVLENAVSIAKGQWGNWVIQHILVQAEKKEDRQTAYQIVIDQGIQLSTDQYASKVVEKALREGGQEFITRFINSISITNDENRSRVSLIDIASDQYGNYVIQWLINNSNEEQKLAICSTIKRHMVSLRGSKFGQRVAFAVDKVVREHEKKGGTYSSKQQYYQQHQQHMIKSDVNIINNSF